MAEAVTQTPFRVLVVGLGQIGLGYDLALGPEFAYSHARAFAQHPAFELAGGVDRDATQRVLLTRHYGCPAFASIEEAAAALKSVDIVVIATPTTLHAEALHTALVRLAPRAVLCEKPLSQDLDEARAMVALCAEQGAQLFVNYMRRADAAVIEIKQRLDSGAIAGPVKGVCWYSKGFRHNGSHFFNLLQYWLGPVESSSVVDPGRMWDDHDPEPDVHVRFARGTILFLAAREEAFSHYTIELVAANGRLRYEQGGQRVEWQRAAAANMKGYIKLEADAQLIENGMQRYQYHVAEQLAAALEGRAHHLSDGHDAMATLAAMEKIIEQRGNA